MNIHISRQEGSNAIFLIEMEVELFLEIMMSLLGVLSHHALVQCQQ